MRVKCLSSCRRQLAARRDRVVPPGLARPLVVDPKIVPVLELPAVVDAARLEEGPGPRGCTRPG